MVLPLHITSTKAFISSEPLKELEWKNEMVYVFPATVLSGLAAVRTPAPESVPYADPNKATPCPE